MKRFLLLLLAIVAGTSGLWAQCNSSLSAVAHPVNNNLLRWDFSYNGSINLSQPAIHQYELNYGNGVTELMTSPSGIHAYVYPAPGTYTATFTTRALDTLTQAVICTHSSTQTVTVNYGPCGSIVSYTTNNNSLPATVNFQVTMPGNPTSPSYLWDFGNGSISTAANPTATYSTSGQYTVTLTTTDAATGCSYTNNISYVLITAGTANCSLNVADFSSVVNNSTVNFTNASAIPPPEYVASYEWNFGDGGSSYAANPTHNYGATGQYTVKLISRWYDAVVNSALLCTDSVTHVVDINSITPPLSNLGGRIHWDSLSYPNAQFRVYLIQHDVLNNTLTAIDSMLSYGSALTQYYYFNNIGAYDNLTVKAAWVNNGGATYGMIPTYTTSSLYWSGADYYSAMVPGSSYSNVDILMQMGTQTSGPGFVGGDIALGANKGASGGVPGVLVFLRDAANQVLKYTYTDADGHYSFYNLPFGTYSVYPEKGGYATLPYSGIIVVAPHYGVVDIDFNQDETQKNIAPRYLSVTGVQPVATTLTIAPVPARDVVQITLSQPLASDAKILVTDLSGRTMMQIATKAGSSSLDLQVSELPVGMYFLQVANSAGILASEKFPIVR